MESPSPCYLELLLLPFGADGHSVQRLSRAELRTSPWMAWPWWQKAAPEMAPLPNSSPMKPKVVLLARAHSDQPMLLLASLV